MWQSPNFDHKFNFMEGREQKRNSAKKHSEHSVYSKKAVRAKEALLEKKLSCPTQVKGKGK
jgi:hypothetical protein